MSLSLDTAVTTLLQHARALPAAAWLAALAGLAGSYGLRAARLHAEWHGRTGASGADCLRLFLLHNAAVVWVPLRGGEAGYPLWLRRHWGVPLQESLPSLLWLRLQDAAVLAGLSAGTLALIAIGLAAPWALLLAGAALLALIAPLERRLERWSRTPASATRAGSRWARGRAALLARRGGRRAWHCCLGNWGLKLAVIAALLAALGLPDGAAALRGAVAGEWAGVLPVQPPGGLGSYEAAVWLGASGAHLAAVGPVLGAALVVHAVMLALAGLGGLAAALLPWPATPRTTPTHTMNTTTGPT